MRHLPGRYSDQETEKAEKRMILLDLMGLLLPRYAQRTSGFSVEGNQANLISSRAPQDGSVGVKLQTVVAAIRFDLAEILQSLTLFLMQSETATSCCHARRYCKILRH